MAYTALPDMRIPYDNDGTLLYWGTAAAGAATQVTGPQAIEMNDHDQTMAFDATDAYTTHRLWMLPGAAGDHSALLHHGTERAGHPVAQRGGHRRQQRHRQRHRRHVGDGQPAFGVVAGLGAGAGRAGLRRVAQRHPADVLHRAEEAIRFSTTTSGTSASNPFRYYLIQLYGEAAAGAMAGSVLVYIDHDTTPGVPFTAAEDFGDMPLGTTAVRQFRLKNTSASKTATGIDIQCNDSDFVIAESASGPWVVHDEPSLAGAGRRKPDVLHPVHHTRTGCRAGTTVRPHRDDLSMPGLRLMPPPTPPLPSHVVARSLYLHVSKTATLLDSLGTPPSPDDVVARSLYVHARDASGERTARQAGNRKTRRTYSAAACTCTSTCIHDRDPTNRGNGVLYVYEAYTNGEIFPWIERIVPEEQYAGGQVEVFGDGFGATTAAEGGSARLGVYDPANVGPGLVMGVVEWSTRSPNLYPANSGVRSTRALLLTVPAEAASGMLSVEETT